MYWQWNAIGHPFTQFVINALTWVGLKKAKNIADVRIWLSAINYTLQKRLCLRPLRVISRSRDMHLSSQTSAAWYSGVCSYVAGDFWVFRGVMRALWSCERGSEIVDGRRRPAMPRSWRSWRRAAATTAGHSHCCSWRCSSRHRSSVDSTTVGAACPWQIQPRYPPTPAVISHQQCEHAVL